MMPTPIRAIKMADANALHKRIDEAVEKVAAEFGLIYKSGLARFNDTELSMKVTLQVEAPADVPAAGTPISAADVATWKHVATANGFEATDIGREFMSNGEIFKVVGWNSRAPKMPVKAIRVRDGQHFKFSPAAVRGKWVSSGVAKPPASPFALDLVPQLAEGGW